MDENKKSKWKKVLELLIDILTLFISRLFRTK